MAASGTGVGPFGPPRRRVTMADVARQAQVSVSTVSFVLNDRRTASISDGTRHRVHDAVAELGYRPNHAARSLRAPFWSPGRSTPSSWPWSAPAG